MRIKKSGNRVVAFAVAVLPTGAVVAAPNIDVDVGVGAEYHSNAARVSDNEQSDVASVARAAIAWRDAIEPLTADVGYSIEHRDFVDDVDQDETAVDGSAELTWNALPRLLNVLVQHQVSQSQTNLRTADTAANREQRSVLTGGLDGFLHLSSVDSLVIRPRYSEVTFEESEQSDSQRTSGDVAWRHALDALSAVNVSLGAGAVQFDEPGSDYDFGSFQVGYAATLARLTYSLDVGLTQIKRDVGEDVDGNTLHAALSYRGDGFEVGGTAVNELTDSSIGLSGNEFSLPDFSNNDSNFDEVDVVERSQIDLFWRQQLNVASSFQFGVGASNDDYDTLPNDQEMAYAQVGYQYTANVFWNFAADARYEKTDFVDDPIGREYTDMTLTLTAQYHFSPELDAQMSLSREERDADTAGEEYDDNIAILSVSYRFF